MSKQERTILVDLLEKMKARSNGVLSFFEAAGVSVSGSFPCIKELQTLHKFHPDQFEALIRFLYPEKFPEGKANAFDWMTLVGGILTGAGTGLSVMGGNANNQSQAEHDLEILRAQEETRKEQEKKSRWYIIGAVVLFVLVFGGVILVMYKQRR